jgi:3-hydroxyacyl-CoA dehydrogenase/enoyl-CoA hydratase/3-hydroxybutyryl-CoA epimerase
LRRRRARIGDRLGENVLSANVTLRPQADGIFAIVFDRAESRVNLIDEQWIDEVSRSLDEAERNGARGIVFLSAKPDHFIAGADVSLIAALANESEAETKCRIGQKLFNRIEDLPIPTVAAISGACLGGGMELVLACKQRIAARGDRPILGLPEVRLGVLPGFGGTVRLPRIAGTMEAMNLILTGRTLRPRDARRMGIVDSVVPKERLVELSIEAARRQMTPRRHRPWSKALLEAIAAGTPLSRTITRSIVRAQARRTSGGHYPAVFSIIDRVLEGRGLAREEALVREARAFGKLAVTPVARNLLWLFQASEAMGRPDRDRPAAKDRIERGALLGAGTMGGGIAGALAESGIAVRMKDVSHDALRAGLAAAAAPLQRRVERRRLTSRERDAILARISPTLQWTGFERASCLIEAVPEVFDLKIRVLREAESNLSPTAFLASNTSSISITRMGNELRHPQRFLGIHFFNPVHRMPLVEIIPGKSTAPEIVERAVALVRRLHKSPLVVADSPGFLVNRLLFPYLNEAALAVEDGWGVERIDRALEKFGMPMGPLRVIDEVGLDVASHVAGVLEDAFGERAAPASVLQRLVQAKAFGVKSGRGFWIHAKGRRIPNRKDIGATSSAIAPADEEIVDRLLLGMVLEASRCLAEEIVSDPGHLDLGTVFGAGFPPFHGGIRRWARSIGESEIRRRLNRWASLHGARFIPGPELDLLFA